MVEEPALAREKHKVSTPYMTTCLVRRWETLLTERSHMLCKQQLDIESSKPRSIQPFTLQLGNMKSERQVEKIAIFAHSVKA